MKFTVDLKKFTSNQNNNLFIIFKTQSFHSAINKWVSLVSLLFLIEEKANFFPLFKKTGKASKVSLWVTLVRFCPLNQSCIDQKALSKHESRDKVGVQINCKNKLSIK